jgi:diaminopimelate decarboxylase
VFHSKIQNLKTSKIEKNMEKLRFERPIIKKLNTGMPNKFGMKTEYEAITHIDGVAVEDLIKDHGSPLYVLSEKTIRQTYNNAKRAFTTRYSKVQFAWSYKTNYLDAVCNVFHDEGSWAEVVSGFEYNKALNNGMPGSKIIFNGPDKSREDLEMAIKNNSYIHVDHFDELYTIIELAENLKETPKLAIRVNMDTGIHPKWDRFGFNYENGEAWDALNRIMLNDKLDLVGLHCHIGTYMMTATAYNVAASKLADLASRIEKKFGHAIKYIDMGGGFASKNTLKGAYLPGSDTCPSFDDYAEAITTALVSSEIKPENLPVLILETGRALIDDAGSILGTVLANKRLADGRRSMVIDVGVNLLFTSFWYEHKITPAQTFTHHTEDTVIYGPLCMNIDVIREHITFPVLKKGDHFVISRIGAYNMTQWLQFITLRPRIVMIDTEGKVHLIRERETNEAITALENVPEHLKIK